MVWQDIDPVSFLWGFRESARTLAWDGLVGALVGAREAPRVRAQAGARRTGGGVRRGVQRTSSSPPQPAGAEDGRVSS